MSDIDIKRGLRVLWATDGSQGSRAVAPVLNGLGHRIGRLQVLTVAPHRLISGARPEPAPARAALKPLRQRGIEEAQALAVQQVFDVQDVEGCKEPVAVWGNPIQSILRQIGQFKPDLTVLGSLGRSNLKFLLIGSVASGVVQHATGPVLVVRPGHDTLRNVLFAYDGSVAARKAVAFLQRLLPDTETQITLVRVIEPFAVPAGTPLAYRRLAGQEARQILHQQRSRASRSLQAPSAVLQAAGYKVTAEVLIGNPYLQLLEAAQRYEADLVVVGSRKPAAKRHYLLGSTAERLVRHCGASVLVVR